MSAYGKLLKCVSDASGVIPQIALINGVCAGMSATVAAMFDLIVTVKDQSKLFVNAPFIVGKEIGSSAAVSDNGLASVTAENEADAYAKIAKLIALLPSNNEEGVVSEEITDDINRTVSVEGNSGAALASILADASDFIEIGASYAKETVAGFATFGGVLCGVIASNASENGGVITCDGAKKAAKMVSLCDSFSNCLSSFFVTAITFEALIKR